MGKTIKDYMDHQSLGMETVVKNARRDLLNPLKIKDIHPC